MFGFEGYLDIETIEKQIFGVYRGRLSWSPYGSPISKYQKNEVDFEREPLDPTTFDEVRTLVEAAKNSKLGELKVRLFFFLCTRYIYSLPSQIFTLVDTNTTTVTLLRATSRLLVAR